ncbi:MAG: ribonuclease III [Deltaproteobacteria bacterium]|nr:ribonuclease III [Deltaproteobacteria bacterium]
MQTIKLGKLGGKSIKNEPLVSVTEYKSKVTIWDDYAGDLFKAKKKKEYEKGSGNRMIPKAHEARPESKDKAFVLDENRDQLNREVDYSAVEASLVYQFKDTQLLSMAFTHRSALGVKERADYERLEFLGDAVLDLAVAHLLSDAHPDAREGELSKMRAALVNTQALANLAKELKLSQYIRLGRGESSSGGAERPSILADVVEAIIGAIYRDSNYDQAMTVIKGIIGESLTQVTPNDPKTELQEILHLAGSEPPEYLLEMVEGSEHAPTFVSVVIIDGEIVSHGRGPTKKASQQEAAAEAIRMMMPSHSETNLMAGQKEIIADALLVRRENMLQKPQKDA